MRKKKTKSIKFFLFKFSLIFLACLPLASCDKIGSWKTNAEIITISSPIEKNVLGGYYRSSYLSMAYKTNGEHEISIKTKSNEYVENIITYYQCTYWIEYTEGTK